MLTKDMIVLSDQGGADSMDDSCIMLYGVVRDSAYKIRQLAENEREAHKAKGEWC
jgi:hypothetical protein